MKTNKEIEIHLSKDVCYHASVLQIVRYNQTVHKQNTKNYLVNNEQKQQLCVCMFAERPKSTAMVMAGRSVHLTTLFPGKA